MVPIKALLVYRLRRDFHKLLFVQTRTVQRMSQLRGDQVVTVDGTITSFLGTENFADYEQNVYEKYQEMAEREIIAKLNSLLSNIVFLSY